MNVKFYDLLIRDATATALAPFSKDYQIIYAAPFEGLIRVFATRKTPEGRDGIEIVVRPSDGKLLFVCSDESPR
jgi:hypothetical protein